MKKYDAKRMSEIVAKIIIGVEDKACIGFDDYTDPMLFKYVWENFRMLRKLCPKEHSDESVIEDTIMKICFEIYTNDNGQD